MQAGEGSDGPEWSRPLRIAALVKQVPVAEAMALGDDGRLRRAGEPLEMNPYCRRAVSKGVQLARASGGWCTVFTLGPPSAEDVLREAIAWGAGAAVHLCDPAFAGSDTLATAQALTAALGRSGPYDLVLVGRNSVDGDTGQVGPELAELTGLAFVSGVRQLASHGEHLWAQLELDDGSEEVMVRLPAVLSVAERLCEPCKVDPKGRAAVAADRIRRLRASDLGEGPWGDAGSPTKVGAVRAFEHRRAGLVLSGSLDHQVDEAIRLLAERHALTTAVAPEPAPAAKGPSSDAARSVDPACPAVAVVVEQDRPQLGAELVGAARKLADDIRGKVVVLVSAPSGTDHGSNEAPASVADEIIVIRGAVATEDVAAGVAAWARRTVPWAILAPSTAFGREVAGRVAAALGAGLVGDAVDLHIRAGELVAAKPAFSGALVADITCVSLTRMVTVRAAALPVPAAIAGEGAAGSAIVSFEEVEPAGRVTVVSASRDDDVEVLARAEVVIGVGAGVPPEDYERLSPLSAILGAELAATRKVTDKGWAPRSRQVGITGRNIAPRLYVAIGVSGKFNHMVGVRSAGTVLAVNRDPSAPVFAQSDIGIVGDWRAVVPLLQAALLAHAETASTTDGASASVPP
jgi:electron transfer flavoprotein alpha subunit